MSRWQDELDRVDWEKLTVASGSAARVPNSLLRLKESSNIDDGWKVYWELDNSVVVQGNVFGAAEAVVPFLIDLVIEHADHRRLLGLELLIQLAGGSTHPVELERGDSDLAVRCRDGVAMSLGFYYSLLESPNEEVRDRVVELIGMLEPDSSRKAWTMEWVATHDPSDRTRQLAARFAREIV